MESKFSTGLIATGKHNTIQLVIISECNIIDGSFTKKDRVIKKVDSSTNKVDDSDVIDTDSTKFIIVKLI